MTAIASPPKDPTITSVGWLIRHMRGLLSSQVVPWGSPIPVFGSLATSRVATLGLNPSNREFVDERGRELSGPHRRFHSLTSLGLLDWSEATEEHRALIAHTCENYFRGNPYGTWFNELDALLRGTRYSYYSDTNSACHLDLAPFATVCKWSGLTKCQRATLLAIGSQALARLLRDSRVDVIILNGSSVVSRFQEFAGRKLDSVYKEDWNLPRKTGQSVLGVCFYGKVEKIGNTKIGRSIFAMGYNHNLQSSFGVTKEVKASIGSWISHTINERIS